MRPALPAASFGLTLFVLGLTFALPVALLPTVNGQTQFKNLSPDMMNVYACTAWAGWAHFIYAFQGQARALRKSPDAVSLKRIALYIGGILVALTALFLLRWGLGVALFGGLVWLYFIDHFIKAELAFEGHAMQRPGSWDRWIVSYQPLLTFGWLTIVLLNVQDVNSRPWPLWGISVLLGAIVLLGSWNRLKSGDARGPLVALFFVCEALVWGTISQRGGDVFLTGVYVFHIAAGSYLHYFGSYFMGMSRSQGRDFWLRPLTILGLNAAVIGLGILTARNDAFSWLRPILGVEWFTLWVGLHLVVSDLFPTIKSWKR